MKTFNEWLAERDPELSEVLGLQTLGRGAKWVAKKGLPFAVQAGMTLADPIALAMPQKPFMGQMPPVSPNREAGTNADDFMAMRAEQEKAKRDKAAKLAARRRAAMGGKPPMPTPDMVMDDDV